MQAFTWQENEIRIENAIRLLNNNPDKPSIIYRIITMKLPKNGVVGSGLISGSPVLHQDNGLRTTLLNLITCIRKQDSIKVQFKNLV